MLSSRLFRAPLRRLSGTAVRAAAASAPLPPPLASAETYADESAERNAFPLSSAKSRKSGVMLLRGEGIGTEVTESVVSVFEAAKAPVDFRSPATGIDIDAGSLSTDVVDLFRETRCAIKGPFFTPIKSPNTGINIQLRTGFDLFANVVHAYNIPGIETRHNDVDIVVVRENTEGEYSGLEHEAVPGVVESLKIISEAKCVRLAEYAFQYALANNRKKVTAVHKANIMKMADGLFLDVCTQISKKYPFIEFENMIVDNCCMQLASRPEQFDVVILPNLYGNIVTNIATGLVGGPGLFPGANIGAHGAIFEQGARHAAMQLAGQDVANPTATILSGVMMLRYLKHDDCADMIEDAVLRVFKDTTIRTADVARPSGVAPVSTTEFTQAVIEHL